MPAITAVLYTQNDALRLGRALETLCPCDEIFVVDHGSEDDTCRIAREYGAKIISTLASSRDPGILQTVTTDWIFCLDPRESLTEGLSAALFEWKSLPQPGIATCFAVFQREETRDGWIRHPSPKTRLVPASWQHWDGWLPIADPSATSLDGELLRFSFP